MARKPASTLFSIWSSWEWLPRSKRKGTVSVGDLKGDCSLPTCLSSERWWLWQASGQSRASDLLPKFIALGRWRLSYRIKLYWCRPCAGACAWRTVEHSRFVVKDACAGNVRYFCCGFFWFSLLFLILVWACITEQVISSIETCLPFSWEFKETTRCGKAPCPVLFSTCVFDKCSVQETVICYI